MSEELPKNHGARVPTGTETIADVFDAHYSYFYDKAGEVAHQQQSGETAIRREYSGRVVFELLQNALDRATKTVQVRLLTTNNFQTDYKLVVANDGQPVRVDPEYPYSDPPQRADRSDFNALCSMHTSNKSPDESIGTKGIGFRSVFSLDTYVRVWSRFVDRKDWWGLEMHSPLDGATWRDRETDTAVSNGIDQFLTDVDLPPVKADKKRPSYHFPIPLSAANGPTSLTETEDVNTAVIVPVPADHKETIVDSIQEFKTRHLYFAGIAPENRKITVQFEHPDDAFTRPTWPASTSDTKSTPESWTLAYWQSSDLQALAEDAEFEKSEPGAAVAWPPRHPKTVADDEAKTPGVYGYLPTLIDGPFGADFQGDFQLSIDRTNLRLDDEVMGPYNKRLIRIGAELHLLKAVQQATGDLDIVDWQFIEPAEVNHAPDEGVVDEARPDLWYFLNPDIGQSKAGEIAVDHIESILFDPERGGKNSGKYERWAQLAVDYFECNQQWPVETYKSFWTATEQWLDHICWTTHRPKTWCEFAAKLCDALREVDAPVVPIVGGEDQGEVGAVSLPPIGESVGEAGQPGRKEKAVFIDPPTNAQLTLPNALETDGRAVTTFNFSNDLYDGSPNALAVTPFNRWSVLSELRQLPNSLEGWTYKPLTTCELSTDSAIDWQYDLLQFAAQLYQLDTGSNQDIPAASDIYDMGWRMRDDASQNATSAGRAIATLFLPTTDGQWEPARQLTQDQVATDILSKRVEDVDLDGFLSFLGVAPAPPENGTPITLVEGGPEGCVEPQDVPPALEQAGSGLPDVTLGTLPPATGPTSNPAAWQESLQAAWDNWLESLVALEYDAAEGEEPTSRTTLVDTLSTRAWVPVATSNDEPGVVPPELIDSPQSAVAPQDITIHVPQQTEFPRLLWSVSNTEPTAELLNQLGAVDGLDDDTLQQNRAASAYRLLDTLHTFDPAQISNPRLQRPLVRLFDRLLNAIVRGDTDATRDATAWLLTYTATGSEDDSIALSDRGLTWRRPTDSAWIAQDTAAQDIMRQHFPTQPLVAGTVLPEVLSKYPPLANQQVTLEQTVHSNPPGGISDQSTRELANKVGDLLPQLLALADATRPLDIDVGTLADQWGTDRFRSANNIWLEVTATLNNDQYESTQFDNSHGNALLRTEDESLIVYDTDGDSVYPSLDVFGEPLAELLLEEQGREVGDLFARALHLHETGNLQEFVMQKGAQPLVETYQRGFDQLTPKEEDILLEKTERALNTIDITLETAAASQLRALTPADIAIPDGEQKIVESEIKDALNGIELPDTRDWTWYRPQFQCQDANRAEWQTWFDQHKDELIPYLIKQLHSAGLHDYEPESLTTRLERHVHDIVCPRVDFEPETAVISWLSTLEIESIPSPESLVREAEAHATSFEPVSDIVSIDSSGSETPIDNPEPNFSETGIYDIKEATATKRAQMAYGQDAEDAALNEIVRRTHDCFEDIQTTESVPLVNGSIIENFTEAFEVLYWPFNYGGVTQTHIESHLQTYAENMSPHALREALHVSSVWDGAGFDLIGLEFDDDDRLHPVRYEVKSLPEGPEPTVHLSKNQYAVYTGVHDNENTDLKMVGDWRLLGVSESGIAVDITKRLAALPDQALTELRSKGIDHDGLLINVPRTARNIAETNDSESTS